MGISNIKIVAVCFLVNILHISSCKQNSKQDTENNFSYTKFLTFKNYYDSINDKFIHQGKLNLDDKNMVAKYYDSLKHLIYPQNDKDSAITNGYDSIYYATFRLYKKHCPVIKLVFPHIDSKDTRMYVSIPTYFGGNDSLLKYIQQNLNRNIFKQFITSKKQKIKINVSFKVQHCHLDSILAIYNGKINECAFTNELCRILSTSTWENHLQLLDSTDRAKKENKPPFIKKYDFHFDTTGLLSIEEH